MTAGHWRMGKGNLRTVFLLHFLLSSPFLAAKRQQTGVFSGVQCLNNYGIQNRRVDCTWHRNQTVGEGPFYLNFSDTHQMLRDLICQLSPSSKAQDELSCSARGLGNFEENDDYKIYLHDASLGKDVACIIWEKKYEPRWNIKCDPPYDLRSNMHTSKCHITWEKPKAYEVIWKTLQWQLEFRATQMAWEQAQSKTVVTSETWMEIDSAEFKSGISYVARMRCKTPDSDDAYISQWSEWSAATEWNVPSGALQRVDSLVQPAVFLSVPLCLGGFLLLLLLVSSFYSRIKSHCLASTPNPAAFFLPLYTHHNGNFQDWIGIKDRDLWLKNGSASMDEGLRIVTHRPLEAMSGVSSVKHYSGTELPSEERVCCLLGALDEQGKTSQYVVIQREQKRSGETKSHLFSGRVSLHLEGLNATGEGFPYFPYRNSLFAEQGEQETESIAVCSEASCSLGTSSSHRGSDLCKIHAVGPRREAEQGAERPVIAGTAPCKQALVLLPTQASSTPFWLIQGVASD